MSLQAAYLIRVVNEGLFAVVLVIGFAAAKALFDGVVVVEENQFAVAVAALHGDACVGLAGADFRQQALDGFDVGFDRLHGFGIKAFAGGEDVAVVCQGGLHAGFDVAAFEALARHSVAHAAAFVCIVGILLHPVGTDADGVALVVAPLSVGGGIVVDGGEAGG